jgi:hypothetical protein
MANTTNSSEKKIYIGMCGIEIAEEVTILPGLIMRPISPLLVDSQIFFIKNKKAIYPQRKLEITPSQFELSVEIEFNAELCYLKSITDSSNIPIWFERLMRLRCGQAFVGSVFCSSSLQFPVQNQSVFILNRADQGLLQRNALKAKATNEQLFWIGRHLKDAIELSKESPLFELLCSAIDEAYEHHNPSSALINLVGVLEQIFSPDNSGESRFRTSILIATYLEKPGKDREIFFNRVRKVYDWRSQVAHGKHIKELDPLHETYSLLIPIAIKMLLEKRVPKPEELMQMVLLGEGSYRGITNDCELLPEGVNLSQNPNMQNLSESELLLKAEDYLKIAEQDFGPRNSQWKLRAVKRNMKPSPYTALFNKQAEIWIGTPQNDHLYKWEIAQEVIHCLDPYDPNRILRLEEGISMVFGMKIAGDTTITDQEYLGAYERTKRLLNQFPDCIKNIREKNNCAISAITIDMLREEAPGFPDEDLRWLMDLFTYGRSETGLA